MFEKQNATTIEPEGADEIQNERDEDQTKKIPIPVLRQTVNARPFIKSRRKAPSERIARR